MLFDDVNYHLSPLKPELVQSQYGALQPRFSLKAFCPIPGNQLQLNTSVGWASTYAARTILQAIRNEWTDPRIISNNAFSPIFVYHLAKDNSQADCSKEITLSDGMHALKSRGAPLLTDFLHFCPSDVSKEVFGLARDHGKVDYARLFDLEDETDYKIKRVKKAIQEGLPVVAGMYSPPSLSAAKRFWQPREQFSTEFPGHAVCVVGFDDEVFDGAFEILNSWGRSWGNEGFMWIRYEDFAEFVKYAYEVFDAPERGQTEPDLSGKLVFKLSNGDEMEVSATDRKGVFRMKNPYSSGTRFRIYVSNNEPAYVYALGSDATGSIFPIFPHKPWISAALGYQTNEIALPDETHAIQMDNTIGIDHFCFIYSKDEMNFDQLIKNLGDHVGSFEQRLKAALYNDLLLEENVFWDKSGIGFSGNSRGRQLISVIVEIEHI